MTIEGRPSQPGVIQDALFRLVSAGYLQTIGARLKEGRLLEAADRDGSAPAVVVSESLARQYWPGESAIRHRIDTGTGDGNWLWMTVVGVVAICASAASIWGSSRRYTCPFTQTTISFFLPSEIAVLTSREPLSIANELQRAVWSVDSERPVSHIRPMSAIVDDELASRSQVLGMLGAFAALALVLAALGIYGVLSYLVSQKRREIGLRMAIGARQWDVVRDIGSYAARLTAIGLGAGIILTIAATRFLATLLYGVSPLDPRAFAAVTVGLAAIAAAASYIPARRAALVDPMIALRDE